ncbi:MAG: penicillin-binding transpeptidase domain-containing protein [Clostridiales bacterium]|nr:penicillin-binding transpeptidase domain-containing protein [Clostridiales bacterium]
MFCLITIFAAVTGRLGYLMLFRADYYSEKAEELHERERDIKAARGKILDRNGVVLADNRTVCTVSVIHNQLEDPEEVIKVLSSMLEMDEEKVRKAVSKVSSREIIRTNVSKEIGDSIRLKHLAGIKVDEDYKRYYPFSTMASRVLGFTGSDNQGIIGLEVEYDEILQGENGKILTLTDAKGVELDGAAEDRVEPIPGNNLRISLDRNIQLYAEQAAEKVLEEKNAKGVSVVIMNPMNGEILAMVNVPEFDLNDPFTLLEEAEEDITEEELRDLQNQMWRNACINDTYEPGSTFKVITMAAALEEKAVTLEDRFFCPGYRIVEDRRIRCHKVAGHGSETFLEGAMNSCNPVFMELGLRLGVDVYYDDFLQFGLGKKTGIDLPGEAGTIMHQREAMGEVELATVSFGQSFQITPIQLVTTIASLINGGTRVTPHFGVSVENEQGEKLKTFTYPVEKNIISDDTSDTLRYILEKVVSEGTGKRAYLEGFSIGGKTATSEKLPRRSQRYISSFIGFSPADNPQVIALITIDEPQGIYYGGTVAAPVIADIFSNVLPYLGIQPVYETEESAESQD